MPPDGALQPVTPTKRITQRKQASEQRFIDWQGIQFDGKHGIHPSIVGLRSFSNATGPGWANPSMVISMMTSAYWVGMTNAYGPLPRSWGRFKGLYHYGQANSILVFDRNDRCSGNATCARTRASVPRYLSPAKLPNWPPGQSSPSPSAETSRSGDTAIRYLSDEDPSSVMVRNDGAPNGDSVKDIRFDLRIVLIAGFAPRNLPLQWSVYGWSIASADTGRSRSDELYVIWIPADSSRLDSRLES